MSKFEDLSDDARGDEVDPSGIPDEGPQSLRYRHPKAAYGELYTIVTPEVRALLVRCYDELGTWRDVAWKTGIKLRVIYRIRRGERPGASDRQKTVSMTQLDKIITGAGVGNLEHYDWYTPKQLIEMGVWKPPGAPIEGAASMRRRQGKKADNEERRKSNHRARLRRRARAKAERLRREALEEEGES